MIFKYRNIKIILNQYHFDKMRMMKLSNLIDIFSIIEKTEKDVTADQVISITYGSNKKTGA